MANPFISPLAIRLTNQEFDFPPPYQTWLKSTKPASERISIPQIQLWLATKIFIGLGILRWTVHYNQIIAFCLDCYKKPFCNNHCGNDCLCWNCTTYRHWKGFKNSIKNRLLDRSSNSYSDDFRYFIISI
jgi:hypothetical protein